MTIPSVSSLDKVNAAMVEAYWKIGQAISEACGGSDRAAYGQLTEQRVQRHKLA